MAALRVASLLFLGTCVQGFEYHTTAYTSGLSRKAATLGRARVLASDDLDELKQPSAPPKPSVEARPEPGFKLTDALSALPYAIGLVSFTTLALSQAGLLDDIKLFGDFEIPKEWLEE
jgi:hypothetical protein